MYRKGRVKDKHLSARNRIPAVANLVPRETDNARVLLIFVREWSFAMYPGTGEMGLLDFYVER